MNGNNLERYGTFDPQLLPATTTSDHFTMHVTSRETQDTSIKAAFAFQRILGQPSKVLISFAQHVAFYTCI